MSTDAAALKQQGNVLFKAGNMIEYVAQVNHRALGILMFYSELRINTVK